MYNIGPYENLHILLAMFCGFLVLPFVDDENVT